ncbi:MAG: hypothetical protein EBU90_19150 [Proteobacteria bacterium]|nr:hypothetical protein [Pseudomonadota bacterium]
MKTFSHSGTTGDLIFSLAAIKALGGGHLYLKLHNMDRMVQEKLGWHSAGQHSGRMTQLDFDVLYDLIAHQDYISGFSVWKGEAVEYDLDNAGKWFMNCPEFPHNNTNTHALACGLNLQEHLRTLQIDPWLTVKQPIKIPGRPYIIFRQQRHNQGNPDRSPDWQKLIDFGLCDQSVFVGLESEYNWFCQSHGITVPHHKTSSMLELAQVIAGCEMMYTSCSSPMVIGVGLGKSMWIEVRKPIDMERFEVNFPYRLNINYF